MAAATIASGPVTDVIGNKRRVSYKLTAPANTNTLATSLYSIDDVQITACDSTALAAADSLSVTAISGGTLTFGVIGTARDFFVVAVGN